MCMLGLYSVLWTKDSYLLQIEKFGGLPIIFISERDGTLQAFKGSLPASPQERAR